MRLIRHKQFLACLRDWDWYRLRNTVVGMMAERMISTDLDKTKLPSLGDLRITNNRTEDGRYIWPERMKLIGLAAEALYEDIAKPVDRQLIPVTPDGFEVQSVVCYGCSRTLPFSIEANLGSSSLIVGPCETCYNTWLAAKDVEDIDGSEEERRGPLY